jgi:hypothetical protein
MEERHIGTFAATRGVPRKLLREEYVIRMAQQRECISDAALKDVPSKSRLKEFVTLMAQRGNYAALRGVPIKLKRVEFVSHMAPPRRNYAGRLRAQCRISLRAQNRHIIL